MAQPTPEQLERINSKFAKRPLSADEVYVFQNLMIGTKLVSGYYEYISPELLNIFFANTLDGVPLMDSHKAFAFLSDRAIPFGRSFNARLEQKADGLVELYGEFYMPLGLEVDGINTDQIAKAIDAGVITDTSIGFMAETAICSICEQDIRECEHWPGEEYDGKLCTVTLYPPGELYENSLVFSGAYDDAKILGEHSRSDAEIPQPVVPVDSVKYVRPGSKCYFVYSKGKRQIYASADCIDKNKLSGKRASTFAKEVPDLGVEIADKQTQEQSAPKVNVDELQARITTLTEEKQKLEEFKANAEAILAEVAKAFGLDGSDDFLKGFKELASFCKLGREYREELVKDTLASGVRAHGNAFAKSVYEKMLANASIEEIKALKAEFDAVVKASIPNRQMTSPPTAVGLPEDVTGAEALEKEIESTVNAILEAMGYKTKEGDK